MKTKTTSQENLAIFFSRIKTQESSNNKNNDQRAAQSINPRLHDHCIHMYIKILRKKKNSSFAPATIAILYK